MASLMHRMPARDATHNENREATELIQLEQNTRVQSRSNLDSRPSRLSNSNSQQQFLWRSVKIFWKSHVAVVVSHDSCRDHFALERTFLGYLRTSLALATLGVVVAQLSRLQNSNPAIRSYLLGIPFAATLVAAAILVLVLGAVRFWRQQNAMLRGKVHSGGWEIITVMLTVFIVSVLLFGLIVAIDLVKD